MNTAPSTPAGLTLEQRVQRVEDVQAVANLKAAYCNAADGGWDRPSHDADAVAALFVDDGVWDGGPFGRADGREQIRALFAGFRRFPFAFHCVSNPVIAVAGDTATGEWHANIAMILDGDRPYALGAVYCDEFVRTDAGWRFSTLRAIPVYAAKVGGFKLG